MHIFFFFWWGSFLSRIHDGAFFFLSLFLSFSSFHIRSCFSSATVHHYRSLAIVISISIFRFLRLQRFPTTIKWIYYGIFSSFDLISGDFGRVHKIKSNNMVVHRRTAASEWYGVCGVLESSIRASREEFSDAIKSLVSRRFALPSLEFHLKSLVCVRVDVSIYQSTIGNVCNYCVFTLSYFSPSYF